MKASIPLKWNQNAMTYFFLVGQVVIFLLMELCGGSTNGLVLIVFGAKVNELIQQGQWWRLFNPIFLHIGWTHLLMNSLTLYYMGQLAESFFGSWRFAFLYVLSGLMGNMASYAFSPNLSAGASTALFGLFAAFILLGYIFSDNYYLQAVSRNFKFLVGMNVVYGLLSADVDNFGHLGGLLGGAFLTCFLAYPKGYRRAPFYRGLALLLYIVGLTLCYSIGGHIAGWPWL